VEVGGGGMWKHVSVFGVQVALYRLLTQYALRPNLQRRFDTSSPQFVGGTGPPEHFVRGG